jgi:hypothetical protein
MENRQRLTQLKRLVKPGLRIKPIHSAKRRKQSAQLKRATVHLLIASTLFLVLMAAAMIAILLRVGP